MKSTRVSACAFAVAASLAGCMSTADVEYTGEVRVTSPELVTISPGVQVFADADEPLFYSHGMYWLWRDGYWYRSDNYRNGYVRVDFVYVPGELRIIERPQVYVQYRRHLGRERFARPPEQQTRTPTYQQPTYQQPIYPSTGPTYPSQPTYPDNYHPNQPIVPGERPSGVNPAPNSPRAMPPDIDHAQSPGQTIRPEDRGNPNAPGQTNRPDDRGNPNAPGNRAAPDRGNPNAPVTAPQDRPDADRGRGNAAPTPPSGSPNAPTQRPDDRGKPTEDRGKPNDRGQGNAKQPGNKSDTGERTKNDRDDQGTGNQGNKPDKDKKDNKKKEKY
jgi:hypothetical protein